MIKYSNTGSGSTTWSSKTETTFSNSGDGKTLSKPKIYQHIFNPTELDVASVAITVNGVINEYKTIIKSGDTYYAGQEEINITEINLETMEEYGVYNPDLTGFEEITLYALIDKQDINTVEINYDITAVQEVTYQISTDKVNWSDWMTKTELESLEVDLLEEEFYIRTSLYSNTDNYPTVEELNIEFEPVTDMMSNIYVANRNDLSSTFMIPYVITQSIGAAKDTFVNETRPTLDYSYMERLLLGDNQYRTLIKFDINEIPDNAVIREAYFDFTAKKKDDSEIQIHKLLDDWTMGATTWANQPEHEEVDSLTDLLNEWIEGKSENHGMMLDVEGSHDYYSSRIDDESAKPKLVVKYGFPDGSALNSMSYMESTVEVAERDDLECSIMVQGVNRPNQPATIEVVYGDTEDITGTISIKTGDVDNFEGEITVNKPQLPSTIYVAERSDLSSTITSRLSDYNFLNASISVSRQDVFANIALRLHEEIDGSITARAFESKNIDSQIIPIRREMESSVIVPHRDNLDGSITIRRSDDEDVNSNIAVNRKELLSGIIVPHRDNLDASITIRQTETEDVVSKIGVNRDWMEATLGIVIASSMESTITIQREADEDFPASLGIRGFGSLDLLGQIIPRPRDVSEIPIYIDIHHSYDIMSTIEVAQYMQLQATISIRSDSFKLPRQWRTISNRVITNAKRNT